jgi:phage terminase Nu1 subunit (DNA packaging protein)
MKQTEAAILLGVKPKTLISWAKLDPPLPVTKISATEVDYDAPSIVQWLVQYEVQKYAQKNVYSSEEKKLAETREAFAKAELQEIKLAEIKGELLPVKEVQTVWTNQVLVIRRGLLNLPHRLATAVEDGLSYQEKKDKAQQIIDEVLEFLASTKEKK